MKRLASFLKMYIDLVFLNLVGKLFHTFAPLYFMHNRYYTTIYARTNIFKFSFVPCAIRDWNNLPHNVVEIADDAEFRKLLLFMIL